MDSLFAVHLLNEVGKGNAQAIATYFDDLLSKLTAITPALDRGREFSLCKTKLEEACFFAKKAMAINPENQIKTEP